MAGIPVRRGLMVVVGHGTTQLGKSFCHNAYRVTAMTRGPKSSLEKNATCSRGVGKVEPQALGTGPNATRIGVVDGTDEELEVMLSHL